MTGHLGSTRTARRAGRSVVTTIALLALGLSAAASASSAATAPASRDSGPPTPPRASVHSSDGVVGPIAEPMPASRLSRVVVSNQLHYRVAPGLRFRQWDQKDARGKIRAYLLEANLKKPGLSLQYAAPSQIAARDELSDIIAPDKAVAGVNGDFFDISDTAAPLGVGVDDGQVLHGQSVGAWLNSFVLTADGTAKVGEHPVVASVPTLPDLDITSVNSPWVMPDGIGLYTRQWGTAPGYAVTDAAKHKDVRQVVIQHGEVVSNTVEVVSGTTIEGRVLIGRGNGAARLYRQLPVGTEAKVVVEAHGKPRLAIGGSAVIVHRGRIQTDDDGELHPRTAIGVDRDTGRILLLVVDGRQDFSRGYTLLELARLMKKLGAEEALNFDGGGSSTMITKRPSGRTRIANSPSDGHERQVANGLELVYKAP
jgi:exopolysaccharide biosynthesis protein